MQNSPKALHQNNEKEREKKKIKRGRDQKKKKSRFKERALLFFASWQINKKIFSGNKEPKSIWTRKLWTYQVASTMKKRIPHCRAISFCGYYENSCSPAENDSCVAWHHDPATPAIPLRLSQTKRNDWRIENKPMILCAWIETNLAPPQPVVRSSTS